MENQQSEDGKKTIQRYNWDALKTEFLQGPWTTISEFSRDKKLPRNPYMSLKMKGWGKDKAQAVSGVMAEYSGELVEVENYEKEQAKKRHASQAKFIQQKAMDALEVLEIKNVDDARKMLLAGMVEERVALGMPAGEGGGTPNLTQVNVNLPKTKFDKIINDEDFAGVLQYIAEVKRERARRSGKSPSPESKTTSG